MKVIIIGAGAAGITAAHILSKKGIAFKVLEASSTHGGRIKKENNFADFPIDLGAEWVHTSIKAKPEVLDKLLKRKDPDYTMFKYVPRKIQLFKNNTIKNISWVRFILQFIGDYKFVNKTWFDCFDELITSEIHKNFLYNTPVTKIDYSSSQVIVQSNSGKVFKCDKVLLTVPIKLLQDRYIEFIPNLSTDKQQAIDQEVVSDGIKIFIEFSIKFYPDMLELNTILKNPFVQDHGYYDAAYGKHSNKNILGLFAHGAAATKYTSQESDKNIIELVLKELDSIYNRKASKYYKKHVIQNWSKEPFIRGSYSMRKGNVKKIASSIENKIFFAGEAYNTKGNTIAVHGASESAYLAIEEMIKNS